MKKLAICITEKWRKKKYFFFNSSFFADESVSDSLKQIIIWFHNHFHRTHWKCSKKDLIFTGKFGINWEYYQRHCGAFRDPLTKSWWFLIAMTVLGIVEKRAVSDSTAASVEKAFTVFTCGIPAKRKRNHSMPLKWGHFQIH